MLSNFIASFQQQRNKNKSSYYFDISFQKIAIRIYTHWQTLSIS